MKYVSPSVEIIEQGPGIEGMLKHIELAGRVCYKSEAQITEDSAQKFFDRMIASGHLSVLEHGTIYLAVPIGSPVRDNGFTWKTSIINFFQNNAYSNVTREQVIEDVQISSKNVKLTTPVTYDIYYVTTNMRVIIENANNKVIYYNLDKSIQDNLETSCLSFMTEPEARHIKRYSVKIINTDIGVTRDFNRHRSLSPSEQSTRFCDYCNDKKFDSGISFCTPIWLSTDDCDALDSNKISFEELCKKVLDGDQLSAVEYYAFANYAAEYSYSNLRKLDWKPEQARKVLPLGTFSSVVYTGSILAWQHFFDLRALGTTGKPHPECQELAQHIMNLFKDRNYF